jgi:hypothetical protein
MEVKTGFSNKEVKVEPEKQSQKLDSKKLSKPKVSKYRQQQQVILQICL